MSKRILTYTLMFVVLVIVQALLMNHIVIFNSAICFIFIYFLIKLPLNIPTNWLLTLGFLLGLTVDYLSDTQGLNALACTVLASLKRPIFYSYEQHDDHIRDIEPGLNSMGWLNFSKFLLSLSAIYSFVVTAVEYMTFATMLDILIKAVASTIFTFFIILAIDSLQYKKD